MPLLKHERTIRYPQSHVHPHNFDRMLNRIARPDNRPAILVLFLFHSISAAAWNAHGHLVTAAIAYKQLGKHQKQAVTDLLLYHPDYEGRWSRGYDTVRSELDLGMYLMMRASVWPDEIRSSANPNHDLNRPRWHYVTYKIQFTATHDTTLPDAPNVVWAIMHCADIIANDSLDKRERAIHLAWIIHLIGDIHQPLHCGSLFNDQYPTGDRGGNDFYVKPDAVPKRLHAVWDDALGYNRNVVEVERAAKKFSRKHSNKRLDLTLGPRRWSIESFRLAISVTHLDGTLTGATTKDEAPPLPGGYAEGMAQLSARRIVESGYRMSHAIRMLL